MKIKSAAICSLIVLSLFATASAQEVQSLRLYPDGVPNSKKAPADYAEKPVNDRISMVTDPCLNYIFTRQRKS